MTDWIRAAAAEIVLRSNCCSDERCQTCRRNADEYETIIRRNFEAYRDTVFFSSARRDKPEPQPDDGA